MKCEYAAALALVGWYLIAPPLINNDPERLVTNAPIGAWQVIRSYESVAACEKDRTADFMFFLNPKRKEPQQTRTRIQMEFCIATNDPRLAK